MPAIALQNPLVDRLCTARELLEPTVAKKDLEQRLPTAIDPMDSILRGGFARGELVELIGHHSSGRYSTVLAILATTTTIGEAVALIDLGDHLDPQTARQAGVLLKRLLWLRPKDLKQAQNAAEILLGGGFALVILDLGTPPVTGGRGSQGSWLRLQKAARDHRGALLVSTPYRVSGPAAAVVVKAHRDRAVWAGQGLAPRRLDGLDLSIVLDKARGRAPGQSESLQLHFESGAVARHGTLLPILPSDGHKPEVPTPIYTNPLPLKRQVVRG